MSIVNIAMLLVHYFSLILLFLIYYREVINGVDNGFPLVNKDISNIEPVERNNYHSATNPDIRDEVEAQISTELQEGRYKIVTNKPHIVSSLGAIPKSNGKVRLIHDASQPPQHSVNDYAELQEKISFASIQQASQMMSKDCYFAKVDLKAACRSMRVKPEHHTLAGLKWKFKGDDHPTYMVDTREPFGSRLAPINFHKITQGVQHIMHRKGSCKMVTYLDDFLLIADTYEECVKNLNMLLQLVRKLGFAVAWEKVEGPSHRLTFLGIVLDSKRMEVQLPEEKVTAYGELLEETLQRKRMSLKEAQSLAGKMNWASQVILLGRPYLRVLFDFMSALKHRNHKRTITTELRATLELWIVLLKTSNGKRVIPQVGGYGWHSQGLTNKNPRRQHFTNNTTLGLGILLYNIMGCLALSWCAAQLGAAQSLNVRSLITVLTFITFLGAVT